MSSWQPVGEYVGAVLLSATGSGSVRLPLGRFGSLDVTAGRGDPPSHTPVLLRPGSSLWDTVLAGLLGRGIWTLGLTEASWLRVQVHRPRTSSPESS